MLLTLYVWRRQKDHVGHAALQIGDVYASFWANERAGKKDISLKKSHPASFSRSYEMDCDREGGRQAGVVTLHGMDVTTMRLAWENVRDQGLRFNLLRQNCSTITAMLLEMGSRRPPSFVPVVKISGWVSSSFKAKAITMILIRSTVKAWSPEQAWRYGRELLVRPGIG